jgi:hypothetical protein
MPIWRESRPKEKTDYFSSFSLSPIQTFYSGRYSTDSPRNIGLRRRKTWEGKMADILKDDVQTYVRKMILEEFESNNNENKAPSGNPKSNKDELRNLQNRPE